MSIMFNEICIYIYIYSFRKDFFFFIFDQNTFSDALRK